MDESKRPEESILTSVKILLGLSEDCIEFDLNIMMFINSAIATLTQIGVGPSRGFVVTSKDDTYGAWLGDMTHMQDVKTYLYYKTRLAFDPPSSSSVMERFKEMIAESETRLSYQVDPSYTFDDVDDLD